MQQRIVIVTGASRGIGAEIALEAGERFKDNTVLLLIARNHTKLDEVKTKINIANQTGHISVRTLQIDFSHPAKVNDYAEKVRDVLSDVDLSQVKELLTFYNHGTMKTGSIEDVADSAVDEFTANVTSVWLFLSAVRMVFPIEAVSKQFHINISSILASQPAASISIYCSSNFKVIFNH